MRIHWPWSTMPPIQRWDDVTLSAFLSELNRRMKNLEHTLKYLTDLGFGQRTPVDGTTAPSVSGIKLLLTGNSAPTTVTAFANGEPGQSLVVLMGDANTTIQNSASLRLKGAVDWVGALHDARHFITDDGVNFVEVQT